VANLAVRRGLTDDERAVRDTVLDRSPALRTTRDQVSEFAEILTQRRGDELQSWMQRVDTDGAPALRSFATGLDRDLDAVTAGLTLSYSSGPVEGAVNRIKMIKRQMFRSGQLRPAPQARPPRDLKHPADHAKCARARLTCPLSPREPDFGIDVIRSGASGRQEAFEASERGDVDVLRARWRFRQSRLLSRRPRAVAGCSGPRQPHEQAGA
jgi:Transposase